MFEKITIFIIIFSAIGLTIAYSLTGLIYALLLMSFVAIFNGTLFNDAMEEMQDRKV